MPLSAGLEMTPLCRMLGLTAPVVQAPIGSATTPELAAAVSNAGGLGMLALTWTPPGSVRDSIRATRALTDRPFGVNLVLEWAQHERVEACAEEPVAAVSTFWGDPLPYVDRITPAAPCTFTPSVPPRRLVAPPLAGPSAAPSPASDQPPDASARRNQGDGQGPPAPRSAWIGWSSPRRWALTIMGRSRSCSRPLAGAPRGRAPARRDARGNRRRSRGRPPSRPPDGSSP
jgi:nitronate monooxygenase